jgi:hypothetical protein
MNPILRNGDPYDEIKIGPSTVVKRGAQDYQQWFEAIDAEGSPGGPDYLTSAAYATSVDGTTWRKQGVVLAPLPAPSWERSEVSPTSMHWDGSRWILYYHGGNNSGPRAVGRATSPTGTGNFTRSGGPILQRGPLGSWDGLFVADAKVIPPWDGPDGLWRLYYIGVAGNGLRQVGLATSTDGILFKKAAQNPILGPGPAGSWDDGTIHAFTPEWDQSSGQFRAWYVARRADAGTAGGGIGYLLSADGVRWTRDPSNPVLTSAPGESIEDSIDSYADDGLYRLVYGQYDLSARPALRGKGEAWLETAARAPEPPPSGPKPEPTPPPSGAVTAAFMASGPDDGDLERGDAAYPPTTPVETDGSTTEPTMLVRRSKTRWPYQPVTVSLVRFDTSSLPDHARIEYAEIQLQVVERGSVDDRSVVAEWYADGWPIDSDDWTSNDSNSAHVGTPISSLAPGQAQVFTLRNLAGIDRRGSTALRLHVSGAGAAPSGLNEVVFRSSENEARLRPTLIVKYRTEG